MLFQLQIIAKQLKQLKIEFNSVGFKSLSGSCNIQVEDKIGYRFYRFFNDFSKVSCDLVREGSYINCSDKEPEELKPKD
jgi:hypothetical protein